MVCIHKGKKHEPTIYIYKNRPGIGHRWGHAELGMVGEGRVSEGE